MRVNRKSLKSALYLALAIATFSPAFDAFAQQGRGNRRGNGNASKARVEDGKKLEESQGREAIAKEGAAQRATQANLQRTRQYNKIARALDVSIQEINSAKVAMRGAAVMDAKPGEAKDSLAKVIRSAMLGAHRNDAAFKSLAGKLVKLAATKNNSGELTNAFAEAMVTIRDNAKGIELLDAVVETAMSSKSRNMDTALEHGLKRNGVREINPEDFRRECKI